MHTEALAQTAKQCNTGISWQQFVCGWNQPHQAHAAATAGHDARPFVLLALAALVVFLVVKAASKGRSAATAK